MRPRLMAWARWQQGALLGLLLALAPTAARAHVKWFTEEAYPVQWQLLAGERVVLALGVMLGAVAALSLLQRLVLRDPLFPNPRFVRQLEPCGQAILAVHAAITLIYLAVQPALLAPNLELPRSGLGYLLGGLQLLVGLAFIVGLVARAGALLLILLFVGAFALFPALDVLDQVLYLGIAVYILIVGRGIVPTPESRWVPSPVWARYRREALTVLRVLAGGSLIVLAFSEKLLNPPLARAFLERYPQLNLFAYLGVPGLDADAFVLAVGLAEAAIGVMLVSGILTRLVVLGAWVPFNAGIPFLPPTELIGHLPIFGIMYVLVVHGAERLPVTAEELITRWGSEPQSP